MSSQSIPNLSISKAWEETRALFASDGRLFASVALALMGVPTMISGLIEPKGGGITGDSPLWVDVLALAFAILAVIGQLALIRLALKPSITVAGAMAHGLRRVGIYLLTAILIGFGLVLVAIPIILIMISAGIPLDRNMESLTGPVLLLIIAIILGCFFLAVRMLMSAPVASAEHAGPIDIIKRSWTLTQGSWWKLFGFLLLLLIAAGALLMAIGAVVGSVVTLALGPLEPMSASALVLALVEGVFNAAFTALFAVMLARIYVQLSGRDSVEAPTSGT